jgi:hypothetical protein
MRIAKEDVDVKMEIPGAVIRQQNDFGDATGLGKISGEYFTLSAGVDTTPLFQGLEGNLCHCPHWGGNYHVQPTARARPCHRSHDKDGQRLMSTWCAFASAQPIMPPELRETPHCSGGFKRWTPQARLRVAGLERADRKVECLLRGLENHFQATLTSSSDRLEFQNRPLLA